jgi:DNA-binding response OmpR family regulator
VPYSSDTARLRVFSDSDDKSPSPAVLLLSDDEALTDFIDRIVRRPWRLVTHGSENSGHREFFKQPTVRLVVLDDQAIEENERGRLLTQIRRHFSGISLLYIAAIQSDGNEKRARSNGAHYYASKPLSLDRFGQVLRSFLHAYRLKDRSFE